MKLGSNQALATPHNLGTMPEDPAVIRLDNIHKWFGDHHVLKGIDLTLRSGEVQVVIGPSGSGKSTLLRCVNLLEIPSEGKVWFQGQDITDIRTDMDATHVSITFTDTGGGMSAESLSRVFEPYFTTKSFGSGLGLLIVRRIVREHGGEMAIESNEGKGLTLTIRLPYLDKRVRMLEAGDLKSS